ncbi:Anp1 protein [Rhizobium sp. RU35A]|uniref:glycosyltransferase n=1 Tax=Rhizobium sp. RU35A TaxID=1907414 RepID=UPI0009568D17|nr:glycosyltransferase [Rhizobium sp. RU35A]SIP94447.1 Anp1 protein [Rhizobium sp. RU35A]
MTSACGIPRIIHQTWKTRKVPEEMGDPQSWIAHNPGWEYRFWTDDDLLAFFRQERPDLLDLYLSYARPVQRADLARYCILQRFGGLYADVDTRCLASLEPLAGDPRVILCEEPARHWQPALVRGLDRLWFNGTMASPPGHPFWDMVIDLCRRMAERRHGDVLETTGPLVLTAAVRDYADPDGLALNACGLFADIDVHGKPSGGARHGPYGHLTLSTHLWKGSWYPRSRQHWWPRKVARLRQLGDRLFGGPRLEPERMLAGLDRARLQRAPQKASDDDHLLVLVPVGKAEPQLLRFCEGLLALGHPRERLHLWFGQGGGRDESADVLEAFIARHGSRFASAGIVRTGRRSYGPVRGRRGALARLAAVRNALLAQTLTDRHDRVLWIDTGVTDYPPDIVARLRAAGGRIAVPHAVHDHGGPSADAGSFLTIAEPTRADFYGHVRQGLLQPPRRWAFRRHLDDLRYLDTVPLHGVGGAMLMVDADCHRAGLLFPERPYRHLIDTEGFGLLARDAGVIPLGLPQLEIRVAAPDRLHAPADATRLHGHGGGAEHPVSAAVGISAAAAARSENAAI